MIVFYSIGVALIIGACIVFVLGTRWLEAVEWKGRPLTKPGRPLPELARRLYLYRVMGPRTEWFGAPSEIGEPELWDCWTHDVIERKVGRCVRITRKGRRLALGLHAKGATDGASTPTERGALDVKAGASTLRSGRKSAQNAMGWGVGKRTHGIR